MKKLLMIVAVEGEDSYMAKVRGEKGFPVQGSICQMWKQAKHLLGEDQTFRFSEFEFIEPYYSASWSESIHEYEI